ncbi:short transient receptor potential channel 2-like [Montipora foliosa]|uniref:short transient receptor potential channel 2-like n=1 Tax=Montipora foliosa TaxID=591990 RepID=UPI0035F1DC75
MDEKEFEKKLDSKLASDDFDVIVEAVTPKSLGSCSTNALLKSFEVSGYLRYQARQDRPDVEELATLANSVEEFATRLIDPLKSDTKERKKFGESSDLIIDSAIKYQQKKFLSHPVIYKLLDKIWKGRFDDLEPSVWKWTLLKFYCLLDVFLFPLVFIVLFAIRSINIWRRKRRGITQGITAQECLDKYLDYFTTPYFMFARDMISYFLLLGLHIAICVSPTTVPVSFLELAILVFFVGRFVSEYNQLGFTCTKRAKHRRYNYQRSQSCGMRNGIDCVDGRPTMMDDFRSRMEFSGVGKYFSDRWNVLDFTMLVIYVATFMLRTITWGVSTTAIGNKALVIAGYFYGLNTMIMTLRVFGHLMEINKITGTTHIALMSIIEDVAIFFFQFVVGIAAFSIAIAKIYVAEASFISTEERLLRRIKGNNTGCNSSGVSCWWDVMTHLVWTLLGITELDPFNANESLSDLLAKILYAIFIIFALVLLVNMMIAFLCHTYDRVQKNSLRIWSFKRAVTIRTYRYYHPIPVPLNLLSRLFLKLCRPTDSLKLCRPTESNDYGNLKEATGKGERMEALDRVIENLTTNYFEKYTGVPAFPLSDENNINNSLAETQRNREMCDQIVGRVLPDPSRTDGLRQPGGPMICQGDLKEREKRESWDNDDEASTSLFSETEGNTGGNMILYQTFESVEEVKESSDFLLQYMQEKVDKMTQEVKDNTTRKIESTFQVQNQKIEDLRNTLNEILNILKDEKGGGTMEPS